MPVHGIVCFDDMLESLNYTICCPISISAPVAVLVLKVLAGGLSVSGHSGVKVEE